MAQMFITHQKVKLSWNTLTFLTKTDRLRLKPVWNMEQNWYRLFSSMPFAHRAVPCSTLRICVASRWLESVSKQNPTRTWETWTAWWIAHCTPFVTSGCVAWKTPRELKELKGAESSGQVVPVLSHRKVELCKLPICKTQPATSRNWLKGLPNQLKELKGDKWATSFARGAQGKKLSLTLEGSRGQRSRLTQRFEQTALFEVKFPQQPQSSANIGALEHEHIVHRVVALHELRQPWWGLRSILLWLS